MGYAPPQWIRPKNSSTMESIRSRLAVGAIVGTLSPVTATPPGLIHTLPRFEKRNFDEAPLKLAIWMQNAQVVIILFFGHGPVMDLSHTYF